MRTKLLTGIAGLLLASSSMFAGWGVSVGINNGYYGPRAGVYVTDRPAYGYSNGYVEERPYPVTPRCRNEYIAPVVPYGAYAEHDRWNREDRWHNELRRDHDRRDEGRWDRDRRDDRYGRDSWRDR